MALTTIRKRSDLATICVLAPERYDPRREVGSDDRSTLLGDVVNIVRTVVQPSQSLGSCLVLDTSDVREGIIIGRGRLKDGSEIGSAKKVICPRDVIVSRLRPYLRQVAYVDEMFRHAEGTTILCSTEFFVLRPRNERSIAFLVPLLLSARVQEVLAASQEGGHHPRFNDSTLSALPVPPALLERREQTSRVIERSVELYRESEGSIIQAILEAEEGSGSDPGA